jgi:DNA-binding NarL/FixJ family response regulator
VVCLLCLDEGVDHLRARRSSLAKNVAAFLKISRSSLRTFTSLRRRRSSSFSSVVSPSREDRPAPRRKDTPALTPRQLEVLKLLSEGKSAREIGSELYLSQATVRNHIRSLLQALGAHSQLEVLAKAREMGIL